MNFKNNLKINNKESKVLIIFFLCLTIIACKSERKKSDSSISEFKTISDYMTIDEPMVVKGPEATVKLTANLGTSPELPALDRSPFTSIEPIKLFDDLYFVGTIFPVTDNSEAHMVGLMGGMTVGQLKLKPDFINPLLNILKHLLCQPNPILVLLFILKKQILQHFAFVNLVNQIRL